MKLKSQITAGKDEIVELAAAIYNFPAEEFEELNYFRNENIDAEVVVEQLKNELLWKNFQQMFASKITINSADIDAILNNYKNKVGKIEFDFSEIVFLTKNLMIGSLQRKNGNSHFFRFWNFFELLADKFSDLNPQGNNLKPDGYLKTNDSEKKKSSII